MLRHAQPERTTDYARGRPAADLEPESSRAYEVGGKPVLIRHSEGQVFAMANVCSHAADGRIEVAV